jgi:hypothetical protein
MIAPMVVLAAACLAIGLWPGAATQLVMPAVGVVIRTPFPLRGEGLGTAMASLTMIGAVSAFLLSLVLALVLLRRGLLRSRTTTQAMTWDCGYAAPTARMQYTASSFAQPLVQLFRSVLRTRLHEQAPLGYFPASARFESHTPDAAKEGGFSPLFAGVRRGLEQLRWLQQGRLQLYLLYMFIALVALLVWKLGV